MHKKTLLCLLAGSIALAACGCGSGDPVVTEQQKKLFKGGPMPPDVRKKFEEAMKANNANRAASMAAKKPAGAPAGSPTGQTPPTTTGG